MPKESLPTQQFVEIKEIKDGVVYLRNGGLRRILMVSGINFDLKSEEEQEIILGGFQNFLNTLDFSVEFCIHSRKVNVSSYLELIKKRKLEEDNELLKLQIDDYVEFVKSFVEVNPIIEKTFFVVIPYNPIALTSKTRGILGFLQRKSLSQIKTEEGTETQKSLLQLNQRVDEIIQGLESMGIKTQALDNETLIELFYNFYNPQLIEKKGLEILKEIKSPFTAEPSGFRQKSKIKI